LHSPTPAIPERLKELAFTVATIRGSAAVPVAETLVANGVNLISMVLFKPSLLQLHNSCLGFERFYSNVPLAVKESDSYIVQKI